MRMGYDFKTVTRTKCAPVSDNYSLIDDFLTSRAGWPLYAPAIYIFIFRATLSTNPLPYPEEDKGTKWGSKAVIEENI
jgi:hypothetical protein